MLRPYHHSGIPLLGSDDDPKLYQDRFDEGTLANQNFGQNRSEMSMPTYVLPRGGVAYVVDFRIFGREEQS